MNNGLTPLSMDRMDPSLVEVLQPIAGRLGYLGELFQHLGHAPEGLAGFLAYSRGVNATLPSNLNEVLALTVCSRLDLAYERVQHERLAVRLELPRAWVAALVGHGDLAILSPSETVVRDFALAVVEGRFDDARAGLAAVSAEIGERLAAAALMQATRFMSICAMGKVLDVALPVSSIFDEAVAA